MDRKTIFLIALGIFCAAIVCLIVGLALFLTTSDGVIAVVGIAMTAIGAMMGFLPLVVMIALLVLRLVNKNEDKN